MRVSVNGGDRELAHDVSVAELVAKEVDSSDGVAVAVNGSVVPRTQWPATQIAPDDVIEILHASQGG